jgi:hypothetical protein
MPIKFCIKSGQNGTNIHVDIDIVVVFPAPFCSII